MPSGRSIARTSRSIATAIGPSSPTAKATGRAVISAKRSGLLIASVFGSTSAKTMTSTDIVAVA